MLEECIRLIVENCHAQCPVIVQLADNHRQTIQIDREAI